MLKESSQKKLESNYLTTDPCCEQEEDKEGEMLKINRTIRTRTEGMVVMGMEMGD